MLVRRTDDLCLEPALLKSLIKLLINSIFDKIDHWHAACIIKTDTATSAAVAVL